MKPTVATIRALLVDDHALFRESVARSLAADGAIEIETCASVTEALTMVAGNRFDLVLLDHDLGSERASQFLPAARQNGFTGRVLVVTAWVSETEGRRLMRQGASGIFLKSGPLEKLRETMQLVAAGGTWLDPSFAASAEEREQPGAPQGFTERQRKVLRCVVEGLSNKEIAWRMQISESYVKAILQSLFEKTGVRTRGQLVRVAFELYEDQF